MLENSLGSGQGVNPQSSSKETTTNLRPEFEVPRLNLESVRQYVANRGPADPDRIDLKVADYIVNERERSNIEIGIIAIGATSQFHRGLIASIAHESLKAGDRSCGISAVSVRNGNEELKEQQGLFVLNTRDHGDIDYEVVGSITEALSLHDDRSAVMARFTSPAVKCVTTVVTPAGYDFSETGELKVTPGIGKDLEDPHNPTTTIGTIVEGLRMRKLAMCDDPSSPSYDPAAARIAIIPCDNFPPITDPESGQKHGLGDLLRQALLDYCSLTEQFELSGWIENFVSVPNTQVDRICPQPASIEELVPTDPKQTPVIEHLFGLKDTLTVPTEKFSSLVIEPKDPHHAKLPYFDQVHRPRWMNQENVHLAKDAIAWCEMKTYTLNLAHMVVAWFGKYLGQEKTQTADGKVVDTKVHEVMKIPGIAKFLADTFQHSIEPLLKIPRDIKSKGGYANHYCVEILKRLGNFSLPDGINRLDTNGTAKVRERVMPLVLKNQQIADATKLIDHMSVPDSTKEVARFALFAAVWARCVTGGVDENGNAINLHKDPNLAAWKEFGPLDDMAKIKAFEAMQIIFNVTPDEIPYFMRYFENAVMRLGNAPGGLSEILARTAEGQDLHTILNENRPRSSMVQHNIH